MKEKVINIIRDACALEEYVDENTELKTLSLDSLSFVSVIAELEDVFEIEFDLYYLVFETWDCVEDIIKAVEEKINVKK